jgi:hypothetical protein
MPVLLYNIGMSNDTYTQLRIWRTTLKILRLLHAETGEDMIAIVDRLASQELQQIQNANRQNVQVQALSVEKE